MVATKFYEKFEFFSLPNQLHAVMQSFIIPGLLCEDKQKYLIHLTTTAKPSPGGFQKAKGKKQIFEFISYYLILFRKVNLAIQVLWKRKPCKGRQ